MQRNPSAILLAAILAALPLTYTQAQPAPAPLTPKAQFAADSKQINTRYQSDLSLCNSEAEAAGRMQCKRDAKAEYDKALATAKARMSAPPAPTAAACMDCGKVTAVNQVEREGEGGAMGLIAGGVAGALLGNQVGGGRGKDLATIAGAAGGAYAGREVEKRVNTRKVWVVRVNFANGETGSFEFAQDPGLHVGDGVKKANQSIVRM